MFEASLSELIQTFLYGGGLMARHVAILRPFFLLLTHTRRAEKRNIWVMLYFRHHGKPTSLMGGLLQSENDRTKFLGTERNWESPEIVTLILKIRQRLERHALRE